LSQPPRLSPASLAALPAGVARPSYDRAAAKAGVVHLGVGAFHRAHQAAVFDRALSAGDLRWAVTGASLRSPAARDALAPQAGLYTLVERDSAGERRRVIGALKDVLVAPDNPPALIEAMASPDVHLVTLTVTEKGYHLGPNGQLSLDDPAIAADLTNPHAPMTAIGFIVRALAARRDLGLPGFTAISCDNIAGNGAKLGAAVQAFACACEPALADWITANAAFPSTMVDRIVPATTLDDIDALATSIGVRDEAMVKTEPFLQWVIEDRFAGARPDFDSLGVQVVKSVEPWEQAKLRLLNGAHSAMAYLGGLAGLRFVHEFVSDPERVAFIERLWDEAGETLVPTPGLDIPTYRAALLARFANPSLNHSLRQIAMDGSQKLPQRLVAPLAARLELDPSSPALTLAVAAWIKWQSGRTDADEAFKVEDPLAGEIGRRLAGLKDAAERVDAMLSVQAVFPPELAARAEFREHLTLALGSLDHLGTAHRVNLKS
jgi:fructuronate reductase